VLARHDAFVFNERLDLDDLEGAVAARSGKWRQAGARWELVRHRLPDGRLTDKPSASVRVETEAGLAELTVWVSGEADLSHLRLPDEGGDIAVETYELTSAVGLNGCLDDLERHVGMAE